MPAASNQAASANKVTNFVGKIVNGFEIQKLIGKFTRLTPSGQGKFSYVFRAKRVDDNVLVALKLIKVSANLLKSDLRYGKQVAA